MTKKKNLKLDLKLHTLRALTEREQNAVQGGRYGTFPTASQVAGGCTVTFDSCTY